MYWCTSLVWFVLSYSTYIGVPTVNSVSTSGLTLTCTSSNGPATVVTWRRNCAVLPNNAMYQQTQTVTQTQIATYQNMLAIDSAVVDRDGVYTCSVTNARGYDSGVIGVGGKLLVCACMNNVLLSLFSQPLMSQLSQLLSQLQLAVHQWLVEASLSCVIMAQRQQTLPISGLITLVL